MIKQVKEISFIPILIEYLKMEKNIIWTNYGHKGKQCGIQYKESEDPWVSAVGKNRGHELDCTQLNPFFKGSIFESIINEYNIKRARLMWSGPFSCYSMHVDSSPRLHIPLVTNKNCYFLFKNSAPEHMPTGFLYWVDTRKAHTFINCSEKPRLHFIGLVES
jgi:hypothetical protein